MVGRLRQTLRRGLSGRRTPRGPNEVCVVQRKGERGQREQDESYNSNGADAEDSVDTRHVRAS